MLAMYVLLISPRKQTSVSFGFMEMCIYVTSIYIDITCCKALKLYAQSLVLSRDHVEDTYKTRSMKVLALYKASDLVLDHVINIYTDKYPNVT